MLELQSPAVRTCLIYTCVLMAKTLFMEFLIVYQKLKSKICKTLKLDNDFQIIAREKERVDRIKRAHFNDIENVPIFVAIAFAYASTEPDPQTATLLLQIFTCARIVHTLVYAVYVLPQPARAAAFVAGECVTWIMIAKTAINFY